MNPEERDCQRGPTNPRPKLPPARQGSGRFQFAAKHGRPVYTFNLDLQLPATWLGEVELGRVEKLVGRSLACGRILPKLGRGLQIAP